MFGAWVNERLVRVEDRQAKIVVAALRVVFSMLEQSPEREVELVDVLFAEMRKSVAAVDARKQLGRPPERCHNGLLGTCNHLAVVSTISWALGICT